MSFTVNMAMRLMSWQGIKIGSGDLKRSLNMAIATGSLLPNLNCGWYNFKNFNQI